MRARFCCTRTLNWLQKTSGLDCLNCESLHVEPRRMLCAHLGVSFAGDRSRPLPSAAPRMQETTGSHMGPRVCACPRSRSKSFLPSTPQQGLPHLRNFAVPLRRLQTSCAKAYTRESTLVTDQEIAAKQLSGYSVDSREFERNGQNYVPPDPTTTSTGMAVTWLGTSSGAPTRRRNVSGIALRTRQQTVLVDCGEATNRQVAIAGIHPLAISNIFITHMHGDHCFGLVGMLTMISDARTGTSLAEKPLRVFGPPGIKELVTKTMTFSDTQLAMPLVVAEFTTQPERSAPPHPAPSLPGVLFATMAPDFTSNAKQALAQRRHKAPGRNGYEVDVVEGLVWTIPCEHGLTVTAAQLQHRVPCWGYVMKEADTLPRERPDRLQECGFSPGEALALLHKGTKPLDQVETPSGATVRLRELLTPPAAGRKVVLLGDTCNSRAIAEIGRGADLLSHEATFTNSMSQKAYRAQHSTASMAGAFARSIQASALVLTHFSGRYAANTSQHSKEAGQATQDASVGDIRSLLEEARVAYNGPVFPAQDFYTVEVSRRQPGAKPAAKQPLGHERAGAGLIFDGESEGGSRPRREGGESSRFGTGQAGPDRRAPSYNKKRAPAGTTGSRPAQTKGRDRLSPVRR